MSDDDYSTSFHGADAAISTYMSDAIVTLPANASLRQAAQMIAEASVGCVVVGSHDGVLGVITERDIVRAVARDLDLTTTPVSDIAATRLVWASPDSTVGEVAGEMMEDYVRHILVGDGTTVEGVVSMRDVIAAYTT